MIVLKRGSVIVESEDTVGEAEQDSGVEGGVEVLATEVENPVESDPDDNVPLTERKMRVVDASPVMHRERPRRRLVKKSTVTGVSTAGATNVAGDADMAGSGFDILNTPTMTTDMEKAKDDAIRALMGHQEMKRDYEDKLADMFAKVENANA
uniref:Uncharacterized protein n=1 Tax=Daucus carota subsp. sativus TaxID=79200 RepID=A0A166EEK5_DAUCS